MTYTVLVMRRVRLSQSRSDCVSIAVGADRRRAAVAVASLLAVVGLMTRPELGSPPALAALALGAAVLVPLGVVLARALRRHEHTLVRSSGRLLLDGEQLELARVELRVTVTPVMRMPTGYALSLWVMTSVGPTEVPLGRYRTLLEAAGVSGTLEEFVQRANVKPHRHPSSP
jgi:hypothetical protein